MKGLRRLSFSKTVRMLALSEKIKFLLSFCMLSSAAMAMAIASAENIVVLSESFISQFSVEK